MAATQTVIIDFQADFSSVKDATTELVKMGKVDQQLGEQFKKTNTEVKKQGDAFEKAAQSGDKEAKTLKQLKDLMQQFPKTGLQRFLLQVGNELAGAGVKAEDFKKKLDPKDVAPKITTLRQELKLLKEEMQRVALASGVTSEEYKKLAQRAGELDDTIKDVNNDIANSGSDTRGIDNVVGSISALAGGYSALQGAQALFGNESEELQQTLLKVNAAMALATGIQQVSNALTKQGSLTRLADTAATYGQIAAQKIYTFVTGQSTKATTAFKVALAATGIGAFVLLVLTLVTAFRSQNDAIEDTNKLLEDQKRAYDDLAVSIDLATRNRVADAQAAGADEAEVARITEAGLIRQKAKLTENNKELETQRERYKQVRAEIKSLGFESGEVDEIINNLNKGIIDNNKQLAELNTQQNELLSRETVRIAGDQKKAAEDAAQRAKEAAEKAREEAKKARAAGFADFKAGIELQLLEVEKGTRRELELRQRLANAQLQIDLEAEGLTQNQRRLLIQKFFKDRREMEKAFNKDIIADAAEAEKNRLQATLANLSLGEEERLQVKIDFLRIAASEEIAAADGNAAKIKLINAELNAAIAAAKIESIRKTAADEARLLSAQGGAGRRALESVAANEKMKADVRINAIRQLQAIETAAIDREIKANRDANSVKGADNRALEIEYEELLDRKAQATENAEKRITDITDRELQARKDLDMAYIQFAIQGLQELGSIAASIQQNQQQAAQNAIALQKREVDDLLKAGAISEKEAERRNKKIEAEERAAKNRAARQIKALAVFQAVLAIPQAYLAGLQTPVIGAIVGPIYAALAAVQAGIVAARPVPKFATGKRGTWSGVGVVGDAGAELLEREDGSMHVALKPEMVYVGPRDIVYTAAETRQRMPFVNKEAMSGGKPSDGFDYGKMAAAMKQKAAPGAVINIDKEFISESVANGLMKSRYFDRYYRSK